MAGHFSLTIVSPSEKIFEGPARFVQIPGVEGDFGVLFGHAPLVSMLRAGVITVDLPQQQKKRYFATSGYADVSPEGCTILSEHIQDVEEVSEAQAREAVEATERDVAEAEDITQRAQAEKRRMAAQALLDAVRA